MLPSSPRVLLLGATTALGEQILLKLAVAGHEVIAQVPPAPWRGRTDEYAAQVTSSSLADVVDDGDEEPLIVVAAGPADTAEGDAAVTHPSRIRHWVQCVPAATDISAFVATLRSAGVPTSVVSHPALLGEVVADAQSVLGSRIPLAAWRRALSAAFDVADEAAVATAVVHALGRSPAEPTVPGQPTTHAALLHAVAHSANRRPWWLALVPGAHAPFTGLRARKAACTVTHQ